MARPKGRHRGPFAKTAGILAVATVLFVATIHGFLAVTRPTGTGILMVEAWIPCQSLQGAVDAFRSGSYSYMVVVGTQGSSYDHMPNYSDRAVEVLEKMGQDKNRIVKVVSPHVVVHRTFTEARAFRDWTISSGAAACCVDVYTTGVHARKSWITVQSVLGNSYRVGVIAGPEQSYNPRYWFLSRRGIWLVLRNLSGYLYTKYEIAIGHA